MVRRVGFGDGEEARGGRRLLVAALSIVAILAGAGAWIAAGLGGLDGATNALSRVIDGERSVGDFLAVILPPLLIAAALLWFAVPRLIAALPEAPEPTDPLGERADATAPERRVGAPDPAAERKGQVLKGRLAILPALFLGVWLTFWTGGIAMAASILIGELAQGLSGATLFLTVWLAAALLGWVFAARVLFSLLTGKALPGTGGGGRRRPFRNRSRSWSRASRRAPDTRHENDAASDGDGGP